MPSPITTPQRALRSVACVLLGLTTAACGSTSSPGSSASSARPVGHRTITLAPEAPPEPGVHLSLIQQRLDEGTRKADITVINGTRSVLRVRSVALDWAAYPGTAQKLVYPVPALATIDLAYRLPRAVCTRAAGASRAHAIVTTSKRSIRRPLTPEGIRFVTRLWRTDCNQRRVRQAVSAGYGNPDRWSERGRGLGAVLSASLVLHRTLTSAQVDVDQVQGSVLFDLSLSHPTPLLPGGHDLLLPLDISPGRCDQHGRSQSQQTFVWRIWFKLNGGEPTAEVVSPSRAQQVRLLAFLDRACAPAGG